MPVPAWILHVDLDQFLAAVELRRRPELRGRPLVVGGSGDPTQRRQVVQCASYEAREHGVRAGLPLTVAARRCPDAVFLPADAAAYEAASAEVMAILRAMPVQVESWGWDEAFVGARTTDPEALARRVRRAVADETGLSCSIGIGDTRQRAKLATGFAKPAGIFRLDEGNWMAVMAPRPTEALWGIGSRTARALAELGLRTVADLAAADPEWLAARFGPTIGPRLRDLALGGGAADTELVTTPREPKSRGRQATFPSDLTDPTEIRTRLTALAEEIADEVLTAGHTVTRVAVTVRTATFWTRTRSTTLPAPTRNPTDIIHAAGTVLDRFTLTRPVRLLGVRVDLRAHSAENSGQSA
ncbi:MAG TPA: DNA polymerase IV [Actinophytocola sp.]|uniref:DNA polymerase IV n=1 Tax=Actinophytocola sp. TaxID=1872138 RepID=UPI002DDCA59C|nr:DNA polymerase IV [Actinophytocola sp.]HEV2782807.1 DNA polymerase IV [Actinophytocola sp.]